MSHTRCCTTPSPPPCTGLPPPLHPPVPLTSPPPTPPLTKGSLGLASACHMSCIFSVFLHAFLIPSCVASTLPSSPFSRPHSAVWLVLGSKHGDSQNHYLPPQHASQGLLATDIPCSHLVSAILIVDKPFDFRQITLRHTVALLPASPDPSHAHPLSWPVHCT